MGLLQDLDEDLTKAIKSGDTLAKGALKGLKTAISKLGSEKGRTAPVSDAEALTLIQKQVKQRDESAEIFLKENRMDLYDVEIGERDFLKNYLPVQMERSEVETFVKYTIEKLGATTMKDMGRVMGEANKRLAGQADAKMVSEIVKSLLS